MSQEYCNLLQDTLRSSYRQVEKIYNSYLKAGENVYVNIRTGYCMKYRPNNPDYFYTKNANFPLCFNLEKIGTKYPEFVIERLFQNYDKWLTDYHDFKDNERIKFLINKEIDKSKEECKDANFFMNINLLQEDNFYTPDGSQNEDENSDEKNSFIVPDVEIKRIVFKKKLGRRPIKPKIKKTRKNGISEDELKFLGLSPESKKDNLAGDIEARQLQRKRLTKSGRKINRSSFDEAFDSDNFY